MGLKLGVYPVTKGNRITPTLNNNAPIKKLNEISRALATKILILLCVAVYIDFVVTAIKVKTCEESPII